MSRMNREKARKRKKRMMMGEKEKRAMQEEMEDEGMEAMKKDEESPEPEEVQKDYLSESDLMMHMGPTSFEELDAERQARERAQQVQEVTWDVQDLVRNILHSMLPPEEKATKITEVAASFEERVTEAMAEEGIEKDMDLLELEAMLATMNRHAPLLQKAWDFVKEEVSYASRQGKPDSSFALVYTDENGKKVRKYLIHDASHVRNALARAAQQIKRGGEGAADARKALPKIRSAAKKFGIEVTKGLHIEKDAKGDWRWIGKPSNNFIDRQGDIVSKSAHQKYCAWLDANPEMAPAFLSWHTPGTAREHAVDFWMEHEGALIMSGILTESEVAHLLKMQKQTDLGMSVEGVGVRMNGQDPREITDYWLYEVSDLPLDKAANPFTSLETITKEAGMDKLQYLTEMMGSKEKAEDFLKRTGQMQKDLQEAGITSKEAGEAAPEAVETPAQPSLDVEALVERLKKELALDDLNAFVAQAQEDHEKVAVLEGVVKDLQKGEDEKLAEQLTPPAARFAWSRDNRPSQSDATKLKKAQDTEDKKLSKAAPGVPEGYWLSEVTGTAPIVQEAS